MPLMKQTISLVLALSYFWMASVDAASFESARVAADEGRYEDVVSMLTELIDNSNLDDQDIVIARANRGIAYSLTEEYELAKQDLNIAIELSPQHALTQNHLGILAEHVDGDMAIAADWYAKAAEQNLASAQTNLGDLYLRGEVTTGQRSDDYRIALRWYNEAIRQNYTLAKISLGILYRDGLGVEADPEKSVQLFNEGIKAEVYDAYYLMGVALEQGKGVPRDYQKAANHYLQAAENGHGLAQNALGYLYRRGAGVKRDYAEAVKWYRQASEQGVPEGMNRLAWILATCPDRRFCDGEQALILAKAAVEKNSAAGYLDTLAAAYARNGMFPEAVSTLETLLENIEQQSSIYGRYAKRLNQYRNNKPYQL